MIHGAETQSTDSRNRRMPIAFRGEFLLKPYPEELMDVHDVSPVVNSTKYDGPECIQPVSDDEIPSGGQLFLL